MLPLNMALPVTVKLPPTDMSPAVLIFPPTTLPNVLTVLAKIVRKPCEELPMSYVMLALTNMLPEIAILATTPAANAGLTMSTQ